MDDCKSWNSEAITTWSSAKHAVGVNERGRRVGEKRLQSVVFGAWHRTSPCSHSACCVKFERKESEKKKKRKKKEETERN
jgi:hypothetical protein